MNTGSPSFQKNQCLVGRLGLGHRVVGRLGSAVRVSASFQFALYNRRNVLGGKGNFRGGKLSEGDVPGEMFSGRNVLKLQQANTLTAGNELVM